MDRLCFPILLLVSILYMAAPDAVNSATVVAKKRGCNTMDFIKVSCRVTRYPDLCFQSLSQYRGKIQQSPKQLASTALFVSLTRARSVTHFVSMMSRVKGVKGRDLVAVKDCVDNMGDSVDRLSRSVKELEGMGRFRGQSFLWHMSNVQTWVSAALTDEDTCVDGFEGYGSDRHVKASIKSRVVNVAQVTSNALALVNRFAAKRH